MQSAQIWREKLQASTPQTNNMGAPVHNGADTPKEHTHPYREHTIPRRQ
jgi:hypothetical protein